MHRFNGYTHLKSIPGASRELVAEAGRYADRMSVNIEIPTERNLQLLLAESRKSMTSTVQRARDASLRSLSP